MPATRQGSTVARCVQAALLAAAHALAPPLSAQQDPHAAIAAAEKAIAAARHETALLLLWDASDRLIAQPSTATRKATAAKIAQLMPRADPAVAERRTVYTAVSRRLIALSRSYKDRKWLLTARNLAHESAAFDEAVAAQDVAALANVGVVSADPQETEQAFASSFRDGNWRIEEGVLWSPDGLPFGGSAVYLTKTQHENHRIAVEIDLGAAQKEMMFGGDGAQQASVQFQLPENSAVGVVFAWQDEANFALALVRWHGDALQLELRQRHQGTFRELGSTTCAIEAGAREGWFELAFECGAQLRARCAGARLEVAAPELPRGRLGLLVRGTDGADISVLFRAFRPPAAAPAPAGK